MIHNLVHAAEDWPQLPRTLPRFPWQAATLVDELFALLADLTPGELEQAARLLVADLGPLPDAMAWLDLLDLDALAAFLD